MIQALNYHNGLQDFPTVYRNNIYKFESMFEVASSLKSDHVQVAEV